jgi:hypothetical protein
MFWLLPRERLAPLWIARLCRANFGTVTVFLQFAAFAEETLIASPWQPMLHCTSAFQLTVPLLVLAGSVCAGHH